MEVWMPIDVSRTVDVERKGSFVTIPFCELRVGDMYSADNEVWFVDTELVPFKDLEERAEFRFHGRWYIKIGPGNLVHPLNGNLPFGLIDIDKSELILEDPWVGRLALICLG